MTLQALLKKQPLEKVCSTPSPLKKGVAHYKKRIQGENSMSYCAPQKTAIPSLTLDALLSLFQSWEKTINTFALQDIDQKNHPILGNSIRQRQLQRKLEDPRALRICLILFQAEQHHQVPYSLRRLADEMGADKEDMDKNKLMQSQLKTLLKSLVAYGLLNYAAQTKPSQHYQISATEKLQQFFSLIIMPKLAER